MMPSIHQPLVNLSWNHSRNFNPIPSPQPQPAGFKCPTGNFSWNELIALFNWTRGEEENRSLPSSSFDDNHHHHDQSTPGRPTFAQLRTCLLTNVHNSGEGQQLPGDFNNIISSDSWSAVSPLRQRHLLLHDEKEPRRDSGGNRFSDEKDTAFLRKAHVSPAKLRSSASKKVDSGPPIFPPRTRQVSSSSGGAIKPLKYHTPSLPPTLTVKSGKDANVKVKQNPVVTRKDSVIKLKLKAKPVVKPLPLPKPSGGSKIKLKDRIKNKGPVLGGKTKVKVRPTKIKNNNKVKVSKLKPKPKKPYKPGKKEKKGCKKFIPFPLPLAIPFPFGGGGWSIFLLIFFRI